jgi:serine/threonine-protein kinase
VRAGPDPAQGDLWLHDLGSTRLRRLTSVGTATNAVWSRDGSVVTFSVRGGRTISMVSQPVDGDGQGHTLFSEDAGLWPGSWTPDGRALAYMTFRPGRTGGDISVYEPGGAVESRHYLDSTSTEWGARLSPNGRWMAYVSNESGRWEVYLRPFPGPAGDVQISTGGGTEVVWARSGREVFFRNGRGLFAVRVGPGPALEVSAPTLVFEGRYATALPGVASYDVSPDGSRFLMVKPGAEEAEPRRLRFVLNWARGS